MGYYDTIAKGYDELHKEEQHKKLAIVLEYLQDLPSGDLLDVGCGTGFSLDEIAQATGRTCQGIEPSKGMIEQYQGLQPIMQGAAEALPFPDASFAGVVSLTAVQNFQSISRGLEEIRRVTKAEGKVIITCLKKSSKLKAVSEIIADLFTVLELIEEEKDIIFVCER